MTSSRIGKHTREPCHVGGGHVGGVTWGGHVGGGVTWGGHVGGVNYNSLMYL